jgi:hypothetical protein
VTEPFGHNRQPALDSSGRSEPYKVTERFGQS